MQTGVVFAPPAPGEFSTGPANAQPAQNGMMPGSIVRSLADQRVELPPIVGRDVLPPPVKIRQDETNTPRGTGVSDPGQKREGLANSLMRFPA